MHVRFRGLALLLPLVMAPPTFAQALPAPTSAPASGDTAASMQMERTVWDMVYNRSIAANTKEERWDWVNKGICLLRDKGIRNNPRAPRLYKELSWFYFHKIQQTSDEAHWYYKTRLAHEWQELMGASVIGATAEQTIADFKAISDAPDTLEDLRRQSPETDPLLDELAKIGFDLQAAGDEQKLAERAEVLLRVLGDFAMFNFVAQPVFDEYSLVNLPPGIDRVKATAVARILVKKENFPAIRTLLSFLRKLVLRVNCRMEPELMLKVMQEFGPLDWRHPCAHSLYWARKCTDVAEEVAKGTHEKDELLNGYRQNIYSLQELIRSGQITYNPINGFCTAQPDPRFIDKYMKVRDAAVERLRKENKEEGVIGGPSFDPKLARAAVHENFLLESAWKSYIWGEPAQATRYWKQAAELYGKLPHNVAGGTYLQPMEQWMLTYMKENIEIMSNTRQFMDGALLRGFTNGLAVGNLETWNHYDQLARRSHAEFQKAALAAAATQPATEKLPQYEQMRATIFAQLMVHPAYDLLVRSRVWHNAPLELGQATFGQIREPIYTEATSRKLNADRLFPPPPGWTPPAVEEKPKDDKPAPQVEIK